VSSSHIGKISGPLRDQIDIHLEVGSVPFRQLSDQTVGHDERPDARAGVRRARAAGRELTVTDSGS
jgi:predicted ATPase with chaperone activity